MTNITNVSLVSLGLPLTNYSIPQFSSSNFIIFSFFILIIPTLFLIFACNKEMNNYGTKLWLLNYLGIVLVLSFVCEIINYYEFLVSVLIWLGLYFYLSFIEITNKGKDVKK